MGLRERAIKGFIWTSFGTIGVGLINLLIIFILARMLTPADFGLIELLIIFTSLSDIIVDSGFSQAIIRDKNATDRELSSVFYLNVLISIIIYMFLFISTPYIAYFYDEPALESMAKVIFLTVIFNAFSVIHNANFSRQLNFKPYAFASTLSMFIAGVIAIILAYMGVGAWALVFNVVIMCFLRAILLWIQSDWHPTSGICRESLKRYFGFGCKLLILGIVDKIVTNLESLIIGKIYTKTQLGYFSQGRKLDSYTLQTVSSVIQKVSYPILSTIGEDEQRLYNGYRHILGITMYCLTPIIAFFVSSSKNVIAGLFGNQWLPAAPYLSLWAICGWVVALYSVFNNTFMVKGKSANLLKISLFRQILRIIAVILFVRISIMVMMWGIVIVTVISGIIYVYWGGRQINYNFRQVLKDLSGIVICGMSAAVITYWLGLFLPASKYFVNMLIQGITTVAIYIFLSWLSRNQYFTEVLKILNHILTQKYNE